MFIIDGESITFKGNGYTFDGQGQGVWDTLGSNGGKTKVSLCCFFIGLVKVLTDLPPASIPQAQALGNIQQPQGQERSSTGVLYRVKLCSIDCG